MPETTIRLQQRSEDLVSEDVREIVSYRPHWMIRRGNLVFFAVLVLMFLLTLFIKYPDVVNGAARIVALNAPKTAVAHNGGKLTAIYITSGQPVRQGQHLALLEATADYKEVMQLQTWLQTAMAKTGANDMESVTATAPPSFAALGDLQNTYQSLTHEWTELRQFVGSGYYQKKKAALTQDLSFNAQLKENIGKQEELNRQERTLQQTEFAAYDSLARDKVVAPMELNKYKSGLLQKDQSLAQTEAQIIGNNMTAHNTQKALLDLQKAVLDQQQKFFTALLLLKSEIEKWIQQYVVTAPEEGTVFFLSPLQTGEQITNGQELFYVQPAAASYYAQLMAGQAGLGKIKEGQAVRLKVENYPSEQYGYLKGTVASIANFPARRDSFLIRVSLSNGLTTAYKKELFFRNNMLAGAEIITDNRKLFDRFFDPLRKLWRQ